MTVNYVDFRKYTSWLGGKMDLAILYLKQLYMTEIDFYSLSMESMFMNIFLYFLFYKGSYIVQYSPFLKNLFKLNFFWQSI